MTTHTGQRVTEADFKGRKTLLFFGYTHCPDFCPATLYTLGAALRQLPEDVPVPQTVLVSVDPARDTPQALGVYITSNGFPQDIVALTGTEAELHTVARLFGPDYSLEAPQPGALGYLVSHGTLAYLMDEDWKIESFFTPDERPADIAACIAAMS